MRAEVAASTRGLTCSAGVAPNELLAKILSNDKKPDGQASVEWTREAIVANLAPRSVRSLPGVGKVTESLLKELGVETCADVLRERARLRAALGKRVAVWLMCSALGISESGGDGGGGAGGGGASSDEEGVGVGRKSLSAERTHFAFGVAEQWSLLARVIAVRPRGEQVEITCVAEHPAVHNADSSADQI